MDDIKRPEPRAVPPSRPTAPMRTKEEGGFFSELFKFALIALFIVLPFRIFVAQPFIVNGASMDPTFKNGDYLIVDQLTFRFGDPERGTPVIFKYPKDPTKYFIKRIVGLPSETVIVRGSKVVIKNDANPQGFELDEPYIEFTKNDDDLTVTLSPDEYFVMGDNRAGSSDSRSWGALPRSLIVGRPLLRLFPLNELGVLPGNFEEPANAR